MEVVSDTLKVGSVRFLRKILKLFFDLIDVSICVERNDFDFNPGLLLLLQLETWRKNVINYLNITVFSRKFANIKGMPPVTCDSCRDIIYTYYVVCLQWFSNYCGDVFLVFASRYVQLEVTIYGTASEFLLSRSKS